MKTKVEYMVVIKGLRYFFTSEQAAKLKATLAGTKYFRVKTLIMD